MSDQEEASPLDSGSGRTATLWGIDPDRAAEWVKGTLISLLFALPFAILVLILWRLVLNYLPGFEWARVYPALVISLVGVALYLKHRSDERTGLRVALRTELDVAGRRDGDGTDHRVYESSLDRLHILSDREIEALVSYHGIVMDPDTDRDAVDDARERAVTAIEDHLVAEVDRGPGTE